MVTVIVQHKDRDDGNDGNDETVNDDDHIMKSLARHKEAIMTNGIDDS